MDSTRPHAQINFFTENSRLLYYQQHGHPMQVCSPFLFLSTAIRRDVGKVHLRRDTSLLQCAFCCDLEGAPPMPSLMRYAINDFRLFFDPNEGLYRRRQAIRHEFEFAVGTREMVLMVQTGNVYFASISQVPCPVLLSSIILSFCSGIPER
jgi:hypothetical protein